MQMMSEKGHPDLVTSLTDESWRLVRKGVAPAFSPHNIRSDIILVFGKSTLLKVRLGNVSTGIYGIA